MSVSQPVIDYIDTATRRIYLLTGVTEYHPLDDIYKEVREMRRTDESLRKFVTWVEAGGNVPKNAAGTLRTPRYAIFNNSKVVVDGDTYVSGEQLYKDSNGDIVGKGPDCVDHSLSPADAYLDYEPPGSEVIVSGSGVTQQDITDIIDGVWLQDINSPGEVTTAAELLAYVYHLTHNKLEKDGNIVTIYQDDGETIWHKFDVSDGGRVEVEIE